MAMTALIPGVAAFVLFLLVHVILWQIIPAGRKGTPHLTAIAVFAYPAACGILHALGYPASLHAAASAPIYGFLAMLYFHFYFGVDRSVSMRILGELVRAEGGTLSADEINRRYPQAGMIERRVGAMEQSGLLTRDGDRYQCTAKGQRLARLALFGKWLYHLDTTG